MFHYQKPTLTNKNIDKARRLLFLVTDTLDANQIPYHLEGGTLLGIVRDKDLLPWDYDVDISIPKNYSSQFKKTIIPKLRSKGYIVTIRYSDKNFGPIEKGQYSIFKVKPYSLYILSWFLPFLSRNSITLDVFIKTNDDEFTYWQAMGKVMKVSNRYYESKEEVNYLGHKLSAPNNYKDYLTEKYGDWSKTVKEWKCGNDEKTICN